MEWNIGDRQRRKRTFGWKEDNIQIHWRIIDALRVVLERFVLWTSSGWSIADLIRYKWVWMASAQTFHQLRWWTGSVAWSWINEQLMTQRHRQSAYVNVGYICKSCLSLNTRNQTFLFFVCSLLHSVLTDPSTTTTTTANLNDTSLSSLNKTKGACIRELQHITDPTTLNLTLNTHLPTPNYSVSTSVAYHSQSSTILIGGDYFYIDPKNTSNRTYYTFHQAFSHHNKSMKLLYPASDSPPIPSVMDLSIKSLFSLRCTGCIYNH